MVAFPAQPFGLPRSSPKAMVWGCYSNHAGVAPERARFSGVAPERARLTFLRRLSPATPILRRASWRASFVAQAFACYSRFRSSARKGALLRSSARKGALNFPAQPFGCYSESLAQAFACYSNHAGVAPERARFLCCAGFRLLLRSSARKGAPTLLRRLSPATPILRSASFVAQAFACYSLIPQPRRCAVKIILQNLLSCAGAVVGFSAFTSR